MSSSEPKSLLGRPPTRAQLAKLQKSLMGSHSVPVSKSIRQYFEAVENGDEPPGKEWLHKPELPTASEILGTDTPEDDVKLKGNIIGEPWPSTEQYLETHYNLIREDSVVPLRDAVTLVRHNPHMHDEKSISIYEKVSGNQQQLGGVQITDVEIG